MVKLCIMKKTERIHELEKIKQFLDGDDNKSKYTSDELKFDDCLWVKDVNSLVGDITAHYELVFRSEEAKLHVELHFEEDDNYKYFREIANGIINREYLNKYFTIFPIEENIQLAVSVNETVDVTGDFYMKSIISKLNLLDKYFGEHVKVMRSVKKEL